MKVKELIEQLNKLDPERSIWVGYDFPHRFEEPDFIPMSEERFSEYLSWPDDYQEGQLKVGDYIHYAE